MYKKNIPKLRFKGFVGEWESSVLNDNFIFSKGKGISKEDIKSDGLNFCIRYAELYTHYKEIVFQIKSKTDISKDDSKLSKKSDLIIPSSGETSIDISTTSCIQLDDVILGGDLNILRPKQNQCGSFFSYYLSNFKKIDIARIAQGHSVVHLYSPHLKKIKISSPNLLEQQKIAEFLIKVDEWVGNLKEQKKNLEKYKKGMMQKIFSQKIRFRDESGNEFEEWKEIKLKNFLKERKEYSIKGKGYPHISLTTQGVVPKSERYNRDFLVGDDGIKDYKVTRLNDLCYNPANLKFGVISINKLGSGIFSPIYVTFDILNQNIDFVGYYLMRKTFINKARRFEQGTVYERMAVNPTDFLKVIVTFPLLPEQQKIADFLTSIDKFIYLKQEQIAKGEEWKKGLMQGLFV